MKLPKHMKYATALTRAQFNGDRDYLNKVDMTNRVALEKPIRVKAWKAKQKEQEDA